MNDELTPLQAWKEIKDFVVDGHPLALETEEKGFSLIETELKDSEKYKKVLKEILALYKEWLGYRKSDFEFFTLLQEIVCKHELSMEVLK